ncbi:hypothetical protein GW17_00020417, partial [Ensete ventricosum]
CHGGLPIEGASEREKPTATRLARGGRSKGDNGKQQQARKAVAAEEEPHVDLSGLGEHGRRLREVDLCSRSLRGGGVVAIGRDVLTVEIEQRGRE